MINIYCKATQKTFGENTKKISIINQKTDVNKFEYINLGNFGKCCAADCLLL